MLHNNLLELGRRMCHDYCEVDDIKTTLFNTYKRKHMLQSFFLRHTLPYLFHNDKTMVSAVALHDNALMLFNSFRFEYLSFYQ